MYALACQLGRTGHVTFPGRMAGASQLVPARWCLPLAAAASQLERQARTQERILHLHSCLQQSTSQTITA